jgi:glycosyltransferase involved in cell wall biosynthesis
MHLHSVIVSFNRLELLKRCYATYKATVSIPHSLVIVDNRSENETRQWLTEHVSPVDQVLFLEHNRFPGYACNRGWELMPPETTFLHRSDNDFGYLHGWCETFLERFSKKVGQVGLRTNEEEEFAPFNVGGNNVIRRALWDAGLRYDERPWGHPEIPKGWTEDSLLSPAIKEMGWGWTRVKRAAIMPLSVEDPNDPYYQRTWRLRGITPPGTAPEP